MFRSALGIAYGRTKNLQRFSKNVILPQEGEKETWNNIDMALAAFGKCLWPSRAVGYLPPSAAPLPSGPCLTFCSHSFRVLLIPQGRVRAPSPLLMQFLLLKIFLPHISTFEPTFTR